MSDFDANQDDMRRISRLSDRELDRLVAGDAGERDLEDLAAFLRETKAVLEEPPAMGVAARQVAAIVEAAERTAGEPTVARVRSPLPETRRRPMMQRKLVYVAAGLASLAVFSGAAYADELPSPVQDGVADVAENVGVSLPSSDDDDNVGGGGGGSGDDNGQSNQQQPAGANVNQGNPGAGTDDDDVDAGGGQSNVDAGGQGGAGAAEDDDQESGQAGGGAHGGQQSQESQDDDESGSQGGGGGAPAQSGGQDDQDDQGGGGGGGQGGGGQDDDD